MTIRLAFCSECREWFLSSAFDEQCSHFCSECGKPLKMLAELEGEWDKLTYQRFIKSAEEVSQFANKLFSSSKYSDKPENKKLENPVKTRSSLIS